MRWSIQIPRKRLAVLAAVTAVILLAVAACGGNGGDEGDGAEAEGGKPQPGGTLTLALNAGWDVLDPATTAFTFARQIMQFIYDPLLRIDPETGKIVPGLAESWELSEDQKVLTLRLRPGVTFHDGTPLNAEAVIFTFERITDPETQSPLAASIAGPVEAIEAVDELTVRIVMKEPFAPFLDSLTQVNLAPVSPAAVKKHGKDFGANPVGAGPFMFESQTPNERVVLVRNPDYDWAPDFYDHDGPAHLERVVIRNVPEDSTRMALLAPGDIDVVYNPIVAQLPRVENDPNLQIVRGVRSGVPRVIVFNTQAWPFDDPLVRRAVAHAIDKEQILESAYGGIGSVANSILTPNIFGFSEEAAEAFPDFDPERAKELLAEAGWEPGPGGILVKDGRRFEISYGSIPGTSDNIRDQLIQANLKEVGISMKIESEEQAAYLDDLRRGKWPLAGMLFAATDPDVLFTVLHSSSIGPAWNTARYENPELDSLLEQARRTADSEQRAALYEQVQMLVAEEVPYIPYYNIENAYATSAAVRNLKVDVQAFWDLYDTWLAR